MRKVALALVLLLAVSTLVGAQTKKTTTPAPASAAPATGMIGVSLNQTLLVPSLRMGMGGWSLDIGGGISSPASGRTDVYLLLRGEIPMGVVSSDLQTYFAPVLALSNVANTSIITLALLLGGEYRFAPKLSIFADLTALSITSSSGTTTWLIGSVSPLIYTGVRYYF